MTTEQRTNIVALARSLIGKPYVYGAKPEDAPNTFDCSSLTQYLMKQEGIEIPRSALLQAAATNGKEIVPTPDFSNLEPGDLLFMTGIAGHYDDELFGGTRHYIGHVVLYAGNGSIIQCKKYPGVVIEVPLKELITDLLYRIELVKRF